MNQFKKLAALTLSCGALLAGCSKKSAEADAGAAAPVPAEGKKAAKGGEVLPGAADVRAAMTQKNYDRAVGGLMALSQVLSTDEQRNEYGTLFQEVRDGLTEASASNPKAAEALAQMRAMRNQR